MQVKELLGNAAECDCQYVCMYVILYKLSHKTVFSNYHIYRWAQKYYLCFYAPRKMVVHQSVRTDVPNMWPAHNFVIWSGIFQLFHRNDHHIETACRVQHLGRYFEGEGRNMTLQQNCVRSITSLLEVRFYNYFTEMITILRRHVTRNIWVDTLKVKVKACICSKLVSRLYLCFLKSRFYNISQKWSLYWDKVPRITFGLFFHFEHCLWHYNSDTTTGIPSCVQTYKGNITRFNRLL
jgi:hypothetical protein